MEFDTYQLGRAIGAAFVLMFVLHAWYDRFVTTVCAPCERKLAKAEVALALERAAKEKLQIANARLRERLKKTARGGRRLKEPTPIPGGQRNGDSPDDP